MDLGSLALALAGALVVLVPLVWLGIHALRVSAFRSLQLKWLAQRHGWQHQGPEYVAAVAKEVLSFSGAHRGHRFEVQERHNSDGGARTEATLRVHGFPHLPDCYIRYRRLRCQVEVRLSGRDARVLTRTPLRWWLIRRPVIGGNVLVSGGVLETSWRYQVHRGVFRRKFAFLLGVAQRLERVSAAS